MNIQLNPLVAHLVKNIPEDSAPHVRSQYDKLIAERDTSDVWRQFAIWLLIDPDHGVIRFTKFDSWKYRAIRHVAYLYSTHCQDRKIWKEAAKVAKAAWNDTMFAEHAADAAADAFCAACDAAKSAAAAARSAAYAAYDAAAADAATAAYYASCAVFYAAAGATAAAYKHMADKLLELLQSAPLKEIP